MDNIVTNKIYIFRLCANSATVNPPLSTVLGNMGLNTNVFCQDFNDFTRDLDFNIKLNILMYINSDRTYLYFLEKPAMPSILRLISRDFNKKVLKSGGLKNVIFYGVLYLDLIRFIIFFYGYFNNYLL
jgi:ribosomal protein L11